MDDLKDKMYKSSNSYIEKILDRLKYMQGVSVLEDGIYTYLVSKDIKFALLLDNSFFVKKTKRSRNMIPYAKEYLINGEEYLEVLEYKNRIVVRELCEATLLDEMK